MNGIYMSDDSYMNYQGELQPFLATRVPIVNHETTGISARDMQKRFRGEAIYNAETDVHFPQLSVGDTLTFAARARAPQTRFPGLSRQDYAAHLRDVVMTMLGLRHTFNTRVGNDYVRGVSGGERKRVSIAEVAIAQSPLQCWDNSTRGLDSATAVEFVRTIRLSLGVLESAAIVSLYQAPQQAYDVCCLIFPLVP